MSKTNKFFSEDFSSAKRRIYWEKRRKFELECLRSEYEDWKFNSDVQKLERLFDR